MKSSNKRHLTLRVDMDLSKKIDAYLEDKKLSMTDGLTKLIIRGLEAEEYMNGAGDDDNMTLTEAIFELSQSTTLICKDLLMDVHRMLFSMKPNLSKHTMLNTPEEVYKYIAKKNYCMYFGSEGTNKYSRLPDNNIYSTIKNDVSNNEKRKES